MAETTQAIQGRQVSRLPTDPMDPAWDDVAPYTVDLVAQEMTKPMGGGSVQDLDVRCLHDTEAMGILLAWENSSEDGTFGIHTHRDSCAIMFPASLTGERPTFMMGNPGNPVVIWQWKPDWEDPAAQEAYTDERYPAYADYYPPPVEAAYEGLGDVPREGEVGNVLVAESFSTLTRTTDPDLVLTSHHTGQGWRVLFRRPLPATYPPLAPGNELAMNFAVWDGASGDSGARKSISLRWHEFAIQGTPSDQGQGIPLGFGPLTAAGALATAGVAWAIRRRMQLARGPPEEEP